MIDKTKLLEIYETMIRIRKFEEKAIQINATGKIGGSIHLYIGEEAIAATVGRTLRKEDYISSTHRGHGHILGKGARSDLAMAELLGKETGYCKGRGGSMHIADIENGIVGANGIVAGGIPGAVGVGLSMKMQKLDNVSVVFFGDAATNQGAFHEAMNLASVWKLPVIFICENNGYGISVTLKESTSVKNISIRAKAYDMPGRRVDGNDVFEIHKALSKAINRARSSKGPSLIECVTYRWRGHWEGDPQVSRSAEDLQRWKDKCPIKKLKKHLLEKENVFENILDKIDKKVSDEIEDAARFALDSPYPDPNDLLKDLFA